MYITLEIKQIQPSMPLFLDLHTLPEGITSKHVAEMHQADLDIEHKYNCRGLTYWCDEKRKTAFCLIEAPNKQALIDLHENAHGAIPTRIIEVNDTIVESFLGRIADPEKSHDVSLNIINDVAFRTLMVVKIKQFYRQTRDVEALKARRNEYIAAIKTCSAEFKGRIVKEDGQNFLISFVSVTDAIHCGVKIENRYPKLLQSDMSLKIGISAGVPVTEKDGIFEDTIQTADYLCDFSKECIGITATVRDLYQSENQNKPLPKGDAITVFTKIDENFMIELMAYVEKTWSQSKLSVTDFEENLGLSKSKLYRTMMDLVGKSPNAFLREYRLDHAINLLEKQLGNISEIAYQTGFSSPAYFSKCFQKKYGILPSNFISTK